MAKKKKKMPSVPTNTEPDADDMMENDASYMAKNMVDNHPHVKRMRKKLTHHMVKAGHEAVKTLMSSGKKY